MADSAGTGSDKNPTGDDLDKTVIGPVSDDSATVSPSPELGETTTRPSVGSETNAAAAAKPQKPKQKEKVGQAVSDSSGGKKKKKKTVRLGDFELIRQLGKGGMGEVYLARQVSLDRTVAIKTLHRQFASQEQFVKRFLREARSMAKLDHPNIVRVFAADTHKGLHFAAIEYIDGRSIQDWLDVLGHLSVGDALHVAIVCAEALSHAHEAQMVHRDVKPDNILVTSKGLVKVADFGLAKATDEDVSMTASGAGLGTPLYMAPEQAKNAKHVDQRSDIYALGATLYHMVTGDLPFMGETALELVKAKEIGRFKSTRQINREVPDRLDLMIAKMLQKAPKHRYGNCAEVAKDLVSLGKDNPSLGFIDGDDKAVSRHHAGTMTQVSFAQTAPAAPRPGPVELSSRQDAERTPTRATSERLYYVQFKAGKGKTQLKKMSTPQILHGIKAGLLNPLAKAKTSTKDEFIPLAQFPEFSSALEKSVVKKKAEARAHSMADTYAKIDRQERRRVRWRWLRNRVRGFFGYVGLVIYLAVIAAVIYGVVLAFPYVIDFAGKAMETKSGSEEKPATEDSGAPRGD